MQANTMAANEQESIRLTLSKFSHEIRNPIALINSELQMLASSHPEITDSECWEDIMENMDYVKQLLNDFSSYNNAAKLTLSDTDLKNYLGAIVASVRPTMDYLGIKLETDISPALSTFPLDRVKMRQALLNLLRNSQEAISSPGGKILVQATEIGSQLCISISDNGCGIDPERLSDIFSPFVTTKPDGTGLGLAVTRQIIEAHGGSIDVSSIPGQGSRFCIFLG